MVTKVDGESHSVAPEERRRIADYVLTELMGGRPVTKIFEQDGAAQKLCSISTWNRWLLRDQSLRAEVVQARELGFEHKIEEMVTIANDREGDPDAQSRRVRIYAIEKAAQMLHPKRFAMQRMDVTSGDKPLEAPKSVTLIDNRIQSVLMLVQQRKDSDEAMRALLE